VPFDPKRTALVLIEYQNDFTSEGGALHDAVRDVMERTGMLERTRELVDAVRAAGVTIVHAPIDSFSTTNLDFILRGRSITTIALGGFLTNCCVESTMRTGYEKGYHVITLSDCVAATSLEEHENAIKFDYPMFSDVMTAEAFMAELQAAPTAAR
jgi:ureidoacrylate peracid hydrolase